MMNTPISWFVADVCTKNLELSFKEIRWNLWPPREEIFFYLNMLVVIDNCFRLKT